MQYCLRCLIARKKTLQCLTRLFDQLPVEDLQIDIFLTMMAVRMVL